MANYTLMNTRELERRVKKDDLGAIHELSRRLVQGIGIAEDFARGFALAKYGTDQGYVKSKTVLGFCYFYEIGRASCRERV